MKQMTSKVSAHEPQAFKLLLLLLFSSSSSCGGDADADDDAELLSGAETRHLTTPKS